MKTGYVDPVRYDNYYITKYALPRALSSFKPPISKKTENSPKEEHFPNIS